jgi:hypothetical protein
MLTNQPTSRTSHCLVLHLGFMPALLDSKDKMMHIHQGLFEQKRMVSKHLFTYKETDFESQVIAK